MRIRRITSEPEFQASLEEDEPEVLPVWSRPQEAATGARMTDPRLAELGSGAELTYNRTEIPAGEAGDVVLTTYGAWL